jgi:predicted outer membrane protein
MGHTKTVNKFSERVMDEHKPVWDKLRSASKLLHTAVKLDFSIEQRRIAACLAAGKLNGYLPSDTALYHGPLGANISKLLEELDAMLD